MSIKKPVRLKPECISCIVNKQLTAYPESTTSSQKTKYMQRLLKIVSEAENDKSAPVIVGQIYDLQKEMFGVTHV